MLERVCDGKQSSDWNMTMEQWENKTYTGYRGCGTRFRWYVGTQCICPHCGYTYIYEIADLQAKRFFVTK